MPLPIIHVDQLCEGLGVTRDWINRTWLASDNPPPHFRDGYQVFFELGELKEWAKRRALGNDPAEWESDYTDTVEPDPSDSDGSPDEDQEK